MYRKMLQNTCCSLSSSSSRASFFKTQFGANHGRSICRVTETRQHEFEVSSNRITFSSYRTLCTSKDPTKKCVLCNSKDIRAMTEQVAIELISKVPGWNMVDEGGTLKLNRSWKVKSFTKGLELFQAVADIAEAEGHHPDLHLTGWNNVKIEIWTHSAGGLTENDYILASKINGLDLQQFLTRKAA